MRTLFNNKRIAHSAWLAWMSQWGKLIDAGVPAVDAIELSTTLLGNTGPEGKLQAHLLSLNEELQAGKTLLTAFHALKTPLPDYLELALLCGQATGDLGKAIRQQTEKATTIRMARTAMAHSLMYPSLVFSMSLACLAFLNQIGSSSGISKHHNSGIGLSDGLLILGMFSALPMLYFRRLVGKTPSGRHCLVFPKHLGVALPNGPLKVSQFFFVIASQLDAGMDLMQVLGRADHNPLRPTAKRNALTRELDRFKYVLHQSLKQGMRFHQAMQSTRAPDFMVTQARLAEQTGQIAQCFYTAATVFELQANKRLERMKNWLGPLTLLGSAAILAYAYQSNLAPLYSNLTGL